MDTKAILVKISIIITKKKYKIIFYKEDVNNLSKFELFIKNKFDFFIHLAGLSE